MTDTLAFQPITAVNPNGTLEALAEATFFETGTSTPITVYSDAAETAPHETPLVADGNGFFAAVFYSGGAVKVVVKTSLGATLYTIDPTLKSAVAGGAASAISFAPTVLIPVADVQLAIERVQTNMAGFVPLEADVAQVFASVAPADASASFQTALNDAVSGSGRLFIPSGTHTFATAIELPSFTTAGSAWDEDNPIVIEGVGANLANIKYTGSDYWLKHPTIGGTTNRGQNVGVEIGGFTLEGPQDLTNAAQGIGIDNARRCRLHHIHFRGFPGGKGVHFYSHNSGGMFGLRLEDCYFGNSKFSSGGGEFFYELADLADWSLKFGVHIDGPNDTVGKITDPLFFNNTFYDLLGSAFLVQSHGATQTVGGAANMQWLANTYGYEGSRKMEEGTLSGVTSASEVQLRTTASSFGAYPDSSLNGYVLGCLDDSNADAVWEYRTITAWTSASRNAVLSSVYSFTPTTSDTYRLSYFDTELAALVTPGQTPSNYIAELGTYDHKLISERSEETNCHFVVLPSAGSEGVVNVGSSFRIQDGRGMEKSDGTLYAPKVHLSARPDASTEMPVRVLLPEINLGDPDFPDAKAGNIQTFVTNGSGGTFETGDVCGLDRNDPTMGFAMGGTRRNFVVGSFGSEQKTKFLNGELMPIVTAGLCDIKIDGAVMPAVDVNDVLYVNGSSVLTLSGFATALSATNAARQMGRIAQADATVTGVQMILFDVCGK